MRDATVDVADWIRTQYNEIEAGARLAAPGCWEVVDLDDTTLIRADQSPDERPRTLFTAVSDDICDPRDADHIALHEPRFVLADLRSKRALLAEHHPAPDWEATYLRDRRGGAYISKPVLAGHCRCQAADDTRRGVWPCTPVLWLAQPLAGRPGWRVEWTLLTSEDPEPGRGVIVRDGHGHTWRRTDDGDRDGAANWEKTNVDYFEPESWTRVCEAGPVTVVATDG